MESATGIPYIIMQGMNELIITLIHVGHCSSGEVLSFFLKKKVFSMVNVHHGYGYGYTLQVVEPSQLDHNSPSAFAANLT